MTLRWPLPALLAWAAGWLLWHSLQSPWDLPVSTLPVALAIGCVRGRTRRAVLLLGWLLSLWLLIGSDRLPAWIWLIALGALLLAYPISAWRDAPVFPTPAGALDPLAQRVHLPAQACVLDAGCGTGAGLKALRRAFPQARHHGIERSLVLTLWARLRCPWAVIFHGDIWQQSWAGSSLVYLFQRPESMQRAWEKACREMTDGSWLVSLEFRIEGQRPQASWPLGPGKRLWLYKIKRSSPNTRPPITVQTR
jgi:hypothetical protein